MKKISTLILLLVLAASVMAQQTSKRLYDFIVPDDGDFKAAIERANQHRDPSRRFMIFIRKGDYRIPASKSGVVNGMDGVDYPDPRTLLTASNVSIIGESHVTTAIRNTCPDVTVKGQWGPANPIEGLRNAYTLCNMGVNNYFQDFRLINGMKDATGRGEALEDGGDKTVCKGMGLWGYQDTYFSNREGGRYYFEGGVIRGRTDYVCGKGDIVFNKVEFRQCAKGGYITAPSIPIKYGYVMLDCVVTGETEGIDNTYTLGRPWGEGTPTALWINTKCLVRPKAVGWGEMSGNRWPARMAEYGSVDANGNPLDVSQRKREWKDKQGVVRANNPVMAKDEAERITVKEVLGGDGWNPESLAKDAPEPANVRLAGGKLVWDGNDQTMCWAVCKNGSVWKFTTEPSMAVANDGSVYSVRAANFMGGLGKAVYVDGFDRASGWNAKLYKEIESRIKVPAFSDKEYLITKFGASATASASKNQKAINKAIDKCSKKGGGRVIVPEGVFLTGAITLKSNVNLVLRKGAVLKFAFEPELYPLVFTHWEGLDCYNYSPCIYANGAKNIGITGEGTIDGNGSNDTFWQWTGVERFGYDKSKTTETSKYPREGETMGERDRLQKMCEDNTPIEERRFGMGCGLRPQLVNLVNSENIIIEGVTMLNSPFWVMHPLFSKNIIVRRVTVINDGPNGDGCDPESCEDVLIEDCVFDTGDDCIAIKSGRNADGRRHGRPSQNIIVRRCTMKDGHGGVVIGSEVSAGCRNVFVEDCSMDSPQLDRVLRIKINSCRGGVTENVYMRNVTVGQCKEAVLRINLNYQPGEAAERGHNPTVRNVWMENVTCQKSKYGILLNGLEDESNIYNVTVKNCQFNGVTSEPVRRTGLSHNLNFDNLVINGSLVVQEPQYGSYADWMVYSEMLRHPDPLTLDFAKKPKWTYVVGIELEAMLDVYLRNKDERILNYLNDYVERMIDNEGNVVKYKYEDFNLDNIRPAHFLYRLNKIAPRRGNEKALKTFFRQLDNQPRTAEGVYWHKAIYRDQVWLDGIFMGLPFRAMAAAEMSKTPDKVYDDITNQIATTYQRTYDEKTGLWKHAWDSKRSIFWADKQTGLSRHTWSRAMGWFTMAMIEVLDALPDDYARRGELIEMLRNSLSAVIRHQDEATGVWYDVMDVSDSRNYLEATASSMFAYCLLKGARLGYLDESFKAAGVKAYNGIVKQFLQVSPDKSLSLTRCCEVSGLGPEGNTRRDGSFDYYMSEPIRSNDGKGIGPFIWATLEMDRMSRD